MRLNQWLIAAAPGLFSYQMFFVVEPLPSLEYLLEKAQRALGDPQRGRAAPRRRRPAIDVNLHRLNTTQSDRRPKRPAAAGGRPPASLSCPTMRCGAGCATAVCSRASGRYRVSRLLTERLSTSGRPMLMWALRLLARRCYIVDSEGHERDVTFALLVRWSWQLVARCCSRRRGCCGASSDEVDAMRTGEPGPSPSWNRRRRCCICAPI